MQTSLRNVLLFAKQNHFLSRLYEPIKDSFIRYTNRGTSRLDVLKTFPLYSPYSGGSYRMRAPLAIAGINDMVPALWAFAQSTGRDQVPVMTDGEYAEAYGAGQAETLAELFTRYGSDKASSHGYYKVYASILARLGTDRPIKLLEIGLGTNNVDVVSHMGVAGKPGASLRAFRDFLPEGQIFGADIDRRTLFQEERISTHYLDQTDRRTFEALARDLPKKFHLMIDDGLHLPSANINSLAFFLDRLEPGGFAVVEDIPRNALDLWHMIASLLPESYDSCIVRSGPSLMFVTCKGD